MQECKMCGQCCKVIALKSDVTEGFLSYHHSLGNEDISFIYKHFRQISLHEALEKRPDPYFPVFLEKVKYPVKVNLWTCDCLDYDTNKCTLHTMRPKVCSGFPFYDGLDMNFVPYNMECGYLEEDTVD